MHLDLVTHYEVAHQCLNTG